MDMRMGSTGPRRIRHGTRHRRGVPSHQNVRRRARNHPCRGRPGKQGGQCDLEGLHDEFWFDFVFGSGGRNSRAVHPAYTTIGFFPQMGVAASIDTPLIPCIPPALTQTEQSVRNPL
jgi:hypothetical protein